MPDRHQTPADRHAAPGSEINTASDECSIFIPDDNFKAVGDLTVLDSGPLVEEGRGVPGAILRRGSSIFLDDEFGGRRHTTCEKTPLIAAKKPQKAQSDPEGNPGAIRKAMGGAPAKRSAEGAAMASIGPATRIMRGVLMVVYLGLSAASYGYLTHLRYGKTRPEIETIDRQFLSRWGLTLEQLRAGDVYRLITSGFVHVEFLPFLVNAISFAQAVLFAASRLHGCVVLVCIYALASVAGCLSSLAQPCAVAYGASGATLGLNGYLIVKSCFGRQISSRYDYATYVVVTCLVSQLAAAEGAIYGAAAGLAVGCLIGAIWSVMQSRRRVAACTIAIVSGLTIASLLGLAACYLVLWKKASACPSHSLMPTTAAAPIHAAVNLPLVAADTAAAIK